MTMPDVLDPTSRGARNTQLAARAWRTVLRRPLAVISIGYLVVVLVVVAAAPVLAPYDPVATDLDHVLSGPSAAHLLGTDQLGRDVLSRLMFGGQVSLTGVAEAVLTLLVLGVAAGLLAGFLGGWVDRVISWVIDLMLAIPVIVTLLVVLSVVGSDETAAMVAVGVLGAPGVARVVRGATLAVRQELFVAAARVAGLPNRQIIVGQILPRVAGSIIVQASLHAGVALLIETGLGYLGLGVQPPTPTWGGLVADASTVIDQQPWLLVPPGVVIGLSIVAFGLVGDAVRDATVTRAARAPHRPRRPEISPASPGGREQLDDSGELQGERTPGESADGALLSLESVAVRLSTPGAGVTVLEGVTLHVNRGETVGLVGESGCGKSLTGRAILGLLPSAGHISAGRVVFDGRDLTGLSAREWGQVRGRQVALVSQEPIGSLDPMFPVGRQIGELVRRHHGSSRRAARGRTFQLLSMVRLPEPEAVARRYPHELSGGMAQRVAIAMALAGEPRLLIADEPTTALDVTVQAEILELLRSLQHETGLAVLLISHDWGVVASLCQRAYVMYAGHVVEAGAVANLVKTPCHPYTASLLRCSPRYARPRTHLRAIRGSVPDPSGWPAGCHFHPRCPLATPECAAGPIPMFEPHPGHGTRCLHHTDVAKEGDHDSAPTPA